MEDVRIPFKEHDLNLPTVSCELQSTEIKNTEHNASSYGKSSEVPKTKDVLHFRSLLSDYRKQLNHLCEVWDEYNHDCEDENVDQIMGDIRTTVGQARLVMKERFQQFEGLVDNCEFGTGEKPVNCEDLQGFWDMIYFQVEDVEVKFKHLDERKRNQWKADFPLASSKPTRKKRKFKSNKEMSVVGKATADRRAEARKRLAAAKAAMKKENVFPLTFDAGFFKVDSPGRGTVQPSPKNDSPSTKKRRAVATPSSANFLHGRFLKRLSTNAVDLKKTLSFEEDRGDEKTDADDNDLMQTAQSSGLHCDVPPVAEDSALHSSKTVRTSASQTDPCEDLQIEVVLEKILDQVNALRSLQTSRTQLLPVEQKDQAPSKVKDSPGRKICNTLQPTPQVEDTYKEQYERVFKKMKFLEAELAAFGKIKRELAEKSNRWKETLSLMNLKSKQMREFYDRVKEKDEDITKRAEKENEELIRLHSSCAESQSKVKVLETDLAKMGEMSANIKVLNERNDHQLQEIQELRTQCDALRTECNCLKETNARSKEELQNLQESFDNLSEEREFEQSEFANEKACLEEHLAKLEDALEATKEHMLKLQQERDQKQTEITSLGNEVKQLKADNKSLQEECDIVKTTSRLDILEQQQEVTNCEQKIREITSTLSEFSSQLHEAGQDEATGPNLVEIALKTPSKSLVVSALLAESNHDEGPANPDVAKELREPLYYLATKLETLTKEVIRACRNAAKDYEEKLRERKIVNETLLTKIEDLEKGSSAQSATKREVELMLRRQLAEVTAQRDERTVELQAEQRKSKVLCERLDRFTERSHNL